MSSPAIEGFESRHASVDGIDLHYWVGGDPDGPPVLLWHGALGSGYTWRKVMPPLARAGCAGPPMTSAPPGRCSWAGDHPEEIAALLYIELPVMRREFLDRLIAFTPEATERSPPSPAARGCLARSASTGRRS